MSGTIVVVEDEASIRDMITDTLSRACFHCLEAEHAAQVYDVIEVRLPDLILLAGISGIEFARRLKRSDRLRNIPIMMLTARR